MKKEESLCQKVTDAWRHSKSDVEERQKNNLEFDASQSMQWNSCKASDWHRFFIELVPGDDRCRQIETEKTSTDRWNRLLEQEETTLPHEHSLSLSLSVCLLALLDSHYQKHAYMQTHTYIFIYASDLDLHFRTQSMPIEAHLRLFLASAWSIMRIKWMNLYSISQSTHHHSPQQWAWQIASSSHCNVIIRIIIIINIIINSRVLEYKQQQLFFPRDSPSLHWNRRIPVQFSSTSMRNRIVKSGQEMSSSITDRLLLVEVSREISLQDCGRTNQQRTSYIATLVDFVDEYFSRKITSKEPIQTDDSIHHSERERKQSQQRTLLMIFIGKPVFNRRKNAFYLHWSARVTNRLSVGHCSSLKSLVESCPKSRMILKREKEKEHCGLRVIFAEIH